ncbi:hypothetical protein QPK87_18745 [Kamptonema cortianum]|nr:hypothetical protein [Geitlerinema splendidum]MDK3158595.1 hypothetical protein [Kamptonema cortianum]
MPASHIILVAGVSAGGKTTLANDIGAALDAPILRLDDYYRDIEVGYTPDQVSEFNWDQLDAFHLDEFCDDVLNLSKGESIARPTYDFTLSKRGPERVAIQPCEYVVVEGQFVLALPALRNLDSTRVFIEVPMFDAMHRRLVRDVHDRGRDQDSVLEQWNNHVLPAYHRWIEPTKSSADIVLDGSQARHENVTRVLGFLGAGVTGPRLV